MSIITFAGTTLAEPSSFDSSNYMGDAFFTPPALKQKEEAKENHGFSSKHSDAPITTFRKYVKGKITETKAKKLELAPTDPNAGIYNKNNVTSEFVSKEEKEEFSEDYIPDGVEEENVENGQNKHFWNKNSASKTAQKDETENIVLDCDNMDYDTDKYCVIATGNVSVLFVEQDTTILADKITYDRMNNTIKAEGNVKILKNGQTVTGDYIFVDMNEESALIENPQANMATIEIKARKGYVYGDRIVEENGTLTVDESFPIEFHPSGGSTPVLSNMMVPKDQTMTNDMEKGKIKVKAKELKIHQKGELEILTIKRANVKKDKWTILKIPALKVYTNKNNDFAETNIWEAGSIRDLGMFIGPGITYGFRRGAVLKAIPILNYNHGFGIGGIGRYSSATNRTQVAYGTAASKFIVHGDQRLDENLRLQYGVYDYMDEWFLGRMRPKYGVGLVYEKAFINENFLLKNRRSAFTHRVDFGYYQDLKEDNHYDKLKGRGIGTIRARYMAEASQNFFNYRNEDKQTAASFDIVGQMSASVYGTGDTQMIGRLGPRLHTQYKRWMQDIGYFQSVYDDNTPMPVYDAYRYGKSNVYFREYFRICKYLTVSWFGSLNLSGDNYNDKKFQESAFFVSFGPDDVKFSIGYDYIRENTFFLVELMMNAKGTKVEYDKLEIKQEKEKEKKAQAAEPKNDFQQDDKKAPVLQRAVVEDIKPVEDVL